MRMRIQGNAHYAEAAMEASQLGKSCIGLYVGLLVKLIKLSTSIDIRHHFDVRISLDKLDPEQLVDLGGALGLSYPKIKRMTSILNDVTAAWLKREDRVLEKSGEPTWSRLADALEQIGQLGVAEDIRNNKIKCCGRTNVNPPEIECKFYKPTEHFASQFTQL